LANHCGIIIIDFTRIPHHTFIYRTTHLVPNMLVHAKILVALFACMIVFEKGSDSASADDVPPGKLSSNSMVIG